VVEGRAIALPQLVRASHQTVHILFLANDRCLQDYDLVVAHWIVVLVTPDFDSAGHQASHQLSPAMPTVAPPRHGASVTLGRVHLMLCVCRVDRSGVSCCCLYATYRLRVDSLSLCSGPGISAPLMSPEIQVQEVLRDFKAPFLYRSYYGPRPTGVFWSSAILPSVCPSICLSHGAAA